MDKIPSGDEYDAEYISRERLEDICDVSQSHPSVNRIEARYNIRVDFKKLNIMERTVIIYVKHG